jgi:hypothetical protein
MIKHSYGKTEEEALTRAGSIGYTVNVQDSIINLGNGYTIDKKSKFRGQQVEIEILVPVGKKIRFDQSVEDKLTQAFFRVKKRYRKRVVDIEFDEHRPFRFKTGIDYVMGSDGNLRDTTGHVIDPKNDDYRYKPDSLELEKSIEKKKQELKELEEQKKKKDSGSTRKKLNKSPGYVMGPSAESSVVWF